MCGYVLTPAVQAFGKRDLSRLHRRHRRRPAASSVFAVEPVATDDLDAGVDECAAEFDASPVLSYTDNRARRMGSRSVMNPLGGEVVDGVDEQGRARPP